MTCFVFTFVLGRFRPWESVWQHFHKIPCQPSYRDLLGWYGARVVTCFVFTLVFGRFKPWEPV